MHTAACRFEGCLAVQRYRRLLRQRASPCLSNVCRMSAHPCSLSRCLTQEDGMEVEGEGGDGEEEPAVVEDLGPPAPK